MMCNVNDSTKDGRLTTARALSSPRPSVLGRGFLTRGHKYMRYLPLVKSNFKGHNSELWPRT